MKEEQERFAVYLQRRYGDRSTPKHYLNDIKMFIEQVGEKEPCQVTSQDVERFIDGQIARGLRPTTINRRLASVHTFFEFIADEAGDKAESNPVRWSRHRLQEGSKLPRDLREAEVNKLFAVIDDVRDRAMFGLMVGAGLRVGEVASVTISALESPPSPQQQARLRVCGKGRKERIVWLTPSWYAAVQEWLARRPASEYPHIFLNQHGRPLSVDGIQYRLKGYSQQTGIRVSCHQLRHTFARRLAEQRMPTESIAELLGHTNISTTQRYTAGADPDLRDAFLAAMTTIDNAPRTEPTPDCSVPHRSSPGERADPHLLSQAFERLSILPDWLQPVLRSYFQRRWNNWRPHVAAQLALILSSQLVRSWRWLVQECQLSDWQDLQRSHLEAWLAARQEGGIKASTIRTELSTLKACLREAMDQDVSLSANLLRIKPPAQQQLLPRYLPPSQMQRLQQTVWNETQDGTLLSALSRAWFLTLAHTGVRLSELLNLRTGDIDFTMQRLFIDGGKSGDERVVYLTASLTAHLAHYLVQRPTVDDNHLWISAAGTPLATYQVASSLRCWGDVCGVHVTPHRLRHTFATQLVNQGMPLASLAKLLGHRTLNMTQHYARLYEHTVKEQFETAMQHVEGILAADWPPLNPSIIVGSPQDALEHSVDSV
jgi:site-specific recombinase XerD